MDSNGSEGAPLQQGPDAMGNACTLPLLGELGGLDEADMEWVREALLAYTEEVNDGEEEATELPRPQIAHLCDTPIDSPSPVGQLADAEESTALSNRTSGDDGRRVSVPHKTSTRMDRKQTRERRRRLELNDSFKELVEVLSEVEAGEGLQAGGDKSWRDHPKGKKKAFRVVVLCRTVYALRYMQQARATLSMRITRLRRKLRSFGVGTEEDLLASSKLQPSQANSRSSSPSSLGSHESWPSISPLDLFDPLTDHRVFSPLPLNLF